jgi:ketosteroid isomerase-like protein
MDVQEREAFAKEWLNGSNERDLERIISDYADDVDFQSPFAVHLFGERGEQSQGRRT